MAKINKKLTCH